MPGWARAVSWVPLLGGVPETLHPPARPEQAWPPVLAMRLVSDAAAQVGRTTPTHPTPEKRCWYCQRQKVGPAWTDLGMMVLSEVRQTKKSTGRCHLCVASEKAQG